LSAAEMRALWQRSAFVWGETDCIMATCNHVLSVTGIDPAAPWRGTYHDEAGARAIYEAYGGPLGLFRFGMSLAGFHEGERAVGRPVVCSLFGHEIAGVDMGSRVAFMAEGRGLVEMRAEVLGAWVI
jgi:hypothetical protein